MMQNSKSKCFEQCPNRLFKNKVCTECSNLLKIQKCSQCFKKIEKPNANKALLDLLPPTSQELLQKELAKSINETKLLQKSMQIDNKSIQLAALLLFNYDKAIKANQYDHIAYTNKGICLNSLKLYEDAVEAFDRAIFINSNYYFAYHKKGNSLFNLHRFEEAIDCYAKSLQRNPNDSLAYNNKGTAYCELKMYEEALDCFNKAIQLNPSFMSSYHKKGIFLKHFHRLGLLKK